MRASLVLGLFVVMMAAVANVQSKEQLEEDFDIGEAYVNVINHFVSVLKAEFEKQPNFAPFADRAMAELDELERGIFANIKEGKSQRTPAGR